MTDNHVHTGLSRRRLLGLGALVAGGTPLLAACGAGSGKKAAAGGGGSGGAISWAAWANPGEAERFKEFSKAYQESSGVKTTFQVVVGDYQSKLLSQLAGSAAPDAFYVGDVQMAKLASSGQLVDLTEYLGSADSPVKEADFYPGLMQWCRPVAGGGLFGAPVDCNPKVFWFNADLLAKAGVDRTPAELYEAGAWNQDALTSLLDQVRRSGKRGLALEGNWFDLFGWLTTFGGTLFDDAGKAVFDTDPKAQQAMEWLFDQLASGNIVYAGSLPKGQGIDALFYAEQLAAITFGRWILPNLKQLKFSYDIAPLPSPSGKDIMPVPVGTAAIAVNAKSKVRDQALAFLGHYVSADGQKARLSGGGNAVPVVSGLDDVVVEGNLPAHGKLFTEIARKGYAVPLPIARNAQIATDFPLLVDKLLKAKSDTPKSFSGKLVRMLNGGQ
jgi:multiple sugar transport system substrate-binding protein